MADCFLEAHLRAVADVAKASSGALFVPGLGDLPDLRVALAGLDQAGINSVTVAWATRRSQLRRGEPARVGTGLVWPLRSGGDVVAIIYLDRAAPGFPTPDDEAHGRLIAERVRTSRETSVGVRLAREAPLDEEMRRLIDVALRETGGNVSAAADVLGMHRDTIYYWASKLTLDLADYRPVRRGR